MLAVERCCCSPDCFHLPEEISASVARGKHSSLVSKRLQIGPQCYCGLSAPRVAYVDGPLGFSLRALLPGESVRPGPSEGHEEPFERFCIKLNVNLYAKTSPIKSTACGIVAPRHLEWSVTGPSALRYFKLCLFAPNFKIRWKTSRSNERSETVPKRRRL